MFRDLSIFAEAGAVALDGYVVDSTEEQVPNWLEEWADRPTADAILAYLGDHPGRVAIISNMMVDEDLRGRGLGAELLDTTVARSNANVILLVCDLIEEQAEGFSLQEFYERRDFEVVADSPGAGPLMVFPPDAAADIRARLEGIPALAVA